VKKVVMKEKSGQNSRVLSEGKRRAFLAEGGAKMHARKSGREKEVWKDFRKDECQIFCLRKLFWDTLVYHVQ
jgi:hypothetical protein